MQCTVLHKLILFCVWRCELYYYIEFLLNAIFFALYYLILFSPICSSVISLTRISRDTPVLTGIPGGACAGGEFPRAARTKRWIFRCNFDIYPRPWTPPKYPPPHHPGQNYNPSTPPRFFILQLASEVKTFRKWGTMRVLLLTKGLFIRPFVRYQSDTHISRYSCFDRDPRGRVRGGGNSPRGEFPPRGAY